MDGPFLFLPPAQAACRSVPLLPVDVLGGVDVQAEGGVQS